MRELLRAPMRVYAMKNQSKALPASSRGTDNYGNEKGAQQVAPLRQIPSTSVSRDAQSSLLPSLEMRSELRQYDDRALHPQVIVQGAYIRVRSGFSERNA